MRVGLLLKDSAKQPTIYSTRLRLSLSTVRKDKRVGASYSKLGLNWVDRALFKAGMRSVISS